MIKKLRVLVLLSGGLDSLLSVRIMQEQGVEVFVLFFRLPFSADLEKSVRAFSKEQKIVLKVVDCTKRRLLKEYLEMVNHPVHGRGASFNPCIDCRIFMLKKAKEIADRMKIELIVTGEVLDERPMSQKKKTMKLIEIESGLKGRILRPLSAKLLEEVSAERDKTLNRSSFFEICGKTRKKQIELARKFGISSYPTPAGGCLLCEKNLKKRFKLFFASKSLWAYFFLLSVGRHFFIDGAWVVLGRDEKENEILRNIKSAFLIIPDYPGPSALAIGKVNNFLKKEMEEMIRAYSKKSSLRERERFEKYRI